MSADLLSQNEIDELLHGVGEEDLESDNAYPVDGQARPFDFNSQDRIVRGNMPTLELINERFAREFRVSMFGLMRKTTEISATGIKVMKFSEYSQSLLVPSSLNLTRVKPLHGTALFVIDPNLVFSLVEGFFGGEGRFHTKIEGREFTHTERRITGMVLDMIYQDLQKAWQPVAALEFNLHSTEINPQFAQVVTPSEVVVVSSFDVQLESGQGELQVCFPWGMLDPLREMLDSSTQGDGQQQDSRWFDALKHDIGEAEIELSVVFTETQMSLRRLLEIEVGDVIPVEIDPSITLYGENIPLFEGRYGVHDGHYALELERRYQAPDLNNERALVVSK